MTQYCEQYIVRLNHYGRKVSRRCKNVAIKIYNGKHLCVNCHAKKEEQSNQQNNLPIWQLN